VLQTGMESQTTALYTVPNQLVDKYVFIQNVGDEFRRAVSTN